MPTPIPQPAGSFLVGNLSEIDSDETAESLKRLQRLYGPIFRLTVFRRSAVVVSSQELVNFVCDESKFGKKIGAGLNQLRALTGDGLFTSHTDEPNWELAHKILRPAFSPQAIRDMFPAMMDIASQLILRWQRFQGETIDVCDSFTRLTLDTLALCSFNYRFNSFYEKKMHHFIDAMVDVLLETARRTKRLAVQNALMIGTTRKYNEDIAFIHNLCDEIVKERRQNPSDVNDLLNRMINGKDPETGYQL